MPTDLDVEAELRARLQADAATVVVPDDLPERIAARARHRTRGRRGLRTAIAAVMVVVVGGAMLIASRSDSPRDETGRPASPSQGAGSPPAGTWQPLPEPPIGPRFQHVAVWTDHEMVVVGGYGEGGDTVSDAAAYDLGSASWRELPDLPDEARGSDVGVWTGQEVVVLGSGTDGTSPSGAAYDPATDEWRTVADPAGAIGTMASSMTYAAWTGEQVLVVGGGPTDPADDGWTSRRAALYDPEADTWTALPDAPEQLPVFGDGFWTGQEMIVVGPEEGSGVAAPERIIALALDPAAGTWRSLAAPPIGVRGSMLAAWTGHELVLGGGTAEGDEPDHTDAVAYDPATDTWRDLPAAPVGFTGNTRYADVAVGQQVVAFDTADPEHRPLVLDVGSGTWTLGPPIDIPRLTRPDELPGRSDAPVVSTGQSVLVWGGGVARSPSEDFLECCRPVGEGLVYTPPAVAAPPG